jgi:hypothetical protein
MTQNPVPPAETPDTTAGEEETIGKSVHPGADTRGASESRKEPGTAVEDMDLSPLGLKDAPAQDENEHSLVDPGNS